MPAARTYVPPPCIGFVDQSTTYSVLTSISGIYGASSDIGRLYLMSVIVIEAVTYIHSTLFRLVILVLLTPVSLFAVLTPCRKHGPTTTMVLPVWTVVSLVLQLEWPSYSQSCVDRGHIRLVATCSCFLASYSVVSSRLI